MSWLRRLAFVELVHDHNFSFMCRWQLSVSQWLSVLLCFSQLLSVSPSLCVYNLFAPPWVSLMAFSSCISLSTRLVLSALISPTSCPRFCTSAFLSTLPFSFLPSVLSSSLLAHVVTPIALFDSSFCSSLSYPPHFCLCFLNILLSDLRFSS